MGSVVSRRWVGGLTVLTSLLSLAGTASAAPPSLPTINEPATDGAFVHPADVHMVASGFSDPDAGDTHICSDWEIVEVASSQVVWQAPCAHGVSKVHIHLGDGSFVVHPYTVLGTLLYDTDYAVRVRFRDSNGEFGPWTQRTFRTYPQPPPGGDVPWTLLQPGYRLEEVTDQLRLPINVAFLPDPGPDPSDPLLYVTELYGTIKVISRDGQVSDYAGGLLNFDPTGPFPGSGEQGLTGIAVDPATGDVFASMVYEDPDSQLHFAKVERFHSSDGGRTAATKTTILTMPNDPEGPSHQISNVTVGPDHKLYVHNGDGFDYATSQNLDSFRGKILRMNLDGTAPADNPFYDASDGFGAPDYIFAYGFRNPFGGAWRSADNAHYEVENGPAVDRFAKVPRGFNFGFDNTDGSMSIGALYNWTPAHAPVNLAFVQPQTFEGSGFPTSKMDHAFVTESGPTYATGPDPRGKRVVEFSPDAAGNFGEHPHTLVEYTGTGQATAVGLAAGPDGLYFAELYKDQGASSPADPGARLFRVRYVGSSDACRLEGNTLTVAVPKGGTERIRRDGDWIEANGQRCGATFGATDQIEVTGAGGDEELIVDLRGGPLGGSTARAAFGLSDIDLVADLGGGEGDGVRIIGTKRKDRIPLLSQGARLNGAGDGDLLTTGVEAFRVEGGRGADRLQGNAGPNVLIGGKGPDVLLGEAGRDDLRGGGGVDRFNGGKGRDRCDARRGERAKSCWS